jgi:hypothetical protein
MNSSNIISLYYEDSPQRTHVSANTCVLPSPTTKCTVNSPAIIHHTKLLPDTRHHLSAQIRWGQSVYVPPQNVSNVVTAKKAPPKEAQVVSDAHKALDSDLLQVQSSDKSDLVSRHDALTF